MHGEGGISTLAISIVSKIAWWARNLASALEVERTISTN